MSRRKPTYEADSESFSAEAYRVKGYEGIAWRVYGWETVPDEDTEWTGINTPTGRVVARMIGDDRLFTFEPDEIEPLEREEYCSECGQIGCTHDGLDRSDAAS